MSLVGRDLSLAPRSARPAIGVSSRLHPSRQRAASTFEAMQGYLRAKVANLLLPRRQNACGCHNEGFSACRAEGLKGLSQTHIVRQNSAETFLTEMGEPAYALELIGPESGP